MAVLISRGVVLSTSGMGIAAVVGIWALFFAIRDERDGSFKLKNILRKRNLIAIGILIVIFIVLAFTVPFLRRAITHIFVPSATGYTAITGHVRNALRLVSKMTPLQWVFGVADNSHNITSHIPGFIDPLYRHEIIGLILSYELYVKCTAKLKFPYNFIGVVILITSFFSAHTHSTVGMLNFLLILMCGFQDFNPQQRGIKPYVAFNSDEGLFTKIFKKK